MQFRSWRNSEQFVQVASRRLKRRNRLLSLATLPVKLTTRVSNRNPALTTSPTFEMTKVSVSYAP
jgi:hypothetical protein